MNPNDLDLAFGSLFSFRGVMSIPSTTTRPLLGRRSPPSMKRRVVLPLPEGPMMSTTSPGSTRRSTLLTALTSPSPFKKILESASVLSSCILPPPEDHGWIDMSDSSQRDIGCNEAHCESGSKYQEQRE